MPLEPLARKRVPGTADSQIMALKAAAARMTTGWAGLVPFIVLPLRRKMQRAEDSFS